LVVTCTKSLKERIRYPVFAFLIIVGCLQVAGDLLKLPALKAFSLALQVSPAPKVFTAQEGFETYSSNFYLDWTDLQGKKHSFHITPKEYYHGIRGPYNRRNAYGAALSYGPVLYANPKTRPMFESVAHYALCGDAPALKELGIDSKTISGPITIRLEPRQKLPENHTWKLSHEISCP
jgi:hypothetical protein